MAGTMVKSTITVASGVVLRIQDGIDSKIILLLLPETTHEMSVLLWWNLLQDLLLVRHFAGSVWTMMTWKETIWLHQY